MTTNIFYEFNSKLVSSYFHASAVGLAKDENDINAEWNLIKGQYEKIDFPIIYRQSRGKVLKDIIDTGWPSLYLISDKVKVLLEINKLSGWKVFPIKLYDKKENEIFGYHGFSITGHCGNIDYSRSKIIEKKYVPDGPICKLYQGIHIDINTWDGSDFFTPDQTYEIFITEKTATVFRKNKLTNLKLENVCDKETSMISVKGINL